jgi:hypothetical protein
VKRHLIIATYDGIGTHYSGVGTIAKNIVTALTSLTGNISLRVSIAYINVDKTSKVFNSECFNAANHLVTKTGGQLIPLSNSTKGQSEWDMWRSFNEWDFTCVSLVSMVNLFLKEEEENFIVLNDTPFLFFAKYRELVTIKNLRYIYFPLSSGENHAFGDKEWRANRIRVENNCFRLIDKDDKSKVISLGKKFAERMTKDYGLSFGEKDYLQNGLCYEKYKYFLDRIFNNKDLLNFGVDIKEGEKIIFAWGRCSIAKGFKELAKAWTNCFDQLPNHHLILQMPNNSGENDYFFEVKSILNGTPRTIVIDDFNPNIWKTILRNENTDVVCIPSLMDPFPHTAIEAKLFCKGMNYVTVISDVDGAVDAFNQNESIHVDPRNTKFFAQKIVEAATMGNESRKKMIGRNKETIDAFNFHKIFEIFIVNNLNS